MQCQIFIFFVKNIGCLILIAWKTWQLKSVQVSRTLCKPFLVHHSKDKMFWFVWYCFSILYQSIFSVNSKYSEAIQVYAETLDDLGEREKGLQIFHDASLTSKDADFFNNYGVFLGRIGRISCFSCYLCKLSYYNFYTANYDCMLDKRRE